MPVTHTHPEYEKNRGIWQLCRDAAEGEQAVKARGEEYLPKKSAKQTPGEYEAYKRRALFFAATGRTKDALVGLPWRRMPDVEYPPSMKAIIDDVTLDGISLNELAKQGTDEVVTVGRAGLLVDFPPTDSKGAKTLADYEKLGARPYAAFYPAEAITNWEEGKIGNKRVLTKVVLRETEYEQDPKDEFEATEIEQYRVLDLTPQGYRQRIFRKARDEDGKDRWVAGPDYFPRMNGKVLPYIPFEFLGPTNGLTRVQKSPIADVATVNLSHYRTMADLENGRHWCGSPTPVFLGDFVTREGDEVMEVKLGSEEGIHLHEGGDAKFLEFSGQGLQELREADKQKREMMVVLGARILAEEKRQTEAAETARIHRAGEESTLQSVVNSVSQSITRVMEYLRDWSGAQGDVSYAINTDFVPAEMTPQELTSTVDAWQRGALTTNDLFWKLKQGQQIREDKTLEDHLDELDNQPPPLGALGGGFE